MTNKEDDSTNILDIIGAGKNIYSLIDKFPSLLGSAAGNGISTASAASGIGAGQLGGEASGLSSLVSGGGLGAAMPFLGLAAFNLYNMFSDKERPSVWFSSGDSPQYVWNGTKPVGQFSEYPGETQSWIKSDKYNYYIAINDIDDPETTQAMIDTFDQTFDEMAASGVDVNDMLAKNSDFAFAGGIMDGMTPDKLYEGVIDYFTPDIEAYMAGETPAERDVTIYPTGGYVDPSTNQRVPGRTASEMGLTEGPYHITVDGGSGSDSSENKTNDQDVKGGSEYSVSGGEIYDEDGNIIGNDLLYRLTPNDDGTYTDSFGNILQSDGSIFETIDAVTGGGQDDGGDVSGGSEGGSTGNSTTESSIDMTGRQDTFWTEFANKWFDDEENAALLFQEHADHMADAAQTNTDRVNDATSEQSDRIDSLLSTYGEPTTFDFFGNEITYVPKASRETALSLANLGQMDWGNETYAASNELNNASATSPVAGDLAYLDYLKSVLPLETSRNQEISNAEYKDAMANVAQQNANTNQQRTDQNEPGILSYAGEGLDIMNGIGKLGGITGMIDEIVSWFS